MKKFFEKRARILISPSGFLKIALGLSLMYVLFSLLGFRAYTCVLTGTLPPGAENFDFGLLAASFYFFAYFAFTLAVPALVIAAGIFWGVETIAIRRAKGEAPEKPVEDSAENS